MSITLYNDNKGVTTSGLSLNIDLDVPSGSNVAILFLVSASAGNVSSATYDYLGSNPQSMVSLGSADAGDNRVELFGLMNPTTNGSAIACHIANSTTATMGLHVASFETVDQFGGFAGTSGTGTTAERTFLSGGLETGYWAYDGFMWDDARYDATPYSGQAAEVNENIGTGANGHCWGASHEECVDGGSSWTLGWTYGASKTYAYAVVILEEAADTGTEVSSVCDARTEGQETVSSTCDARTEGHITASSTVDARTCGGETVSSTVDARTYGKDEFVLIDSYPIENHEDYMLHLGEGTNRDRGQTFTGDGSFLHSAEFYIERIGTGGGGALTVCIYEHTGTWGSTGVPDGAAIATSELKAASTISTALHLEDFVFGGINKILLEDGKRYCAALHYGIPYGDTSNCIDMSVDTGLGHPGNEIYREDPGDWIYWGVVDCLFYIYGRHTSTDTLDARTEGHITSESTCGARTEGHIASESVCDARTEGHISLESMCDARTEGHIAASSTCDARTQGHITVDSTVDARTEGHIAASSTCDARTEGSSTGTQVSSTCDARTYGEETVSSVCGARTEGHITVDSTVDARTEGHIAAESTCDARTEGHITVDSTVDARTEGHIASSSTCDARTEGLSTGTQVSSTCDARTYGEETVSSVCDARTLGCETISSVVDARTEGHIAASSVCDARTEGHITVSSVVDARTEGHITSFSVADARTEGHITSASTVDARTAGLMTISSVVDARTVGGYWASSTCAAYTVGYSSDKGEEDVLYTEIRNLVRWMSKDVEGLKVTENLLGHYIIDGQRLITTRLKLPEFYQEMDMTYTASATSVSLPVDVGWFFMVEIDDDGDRTPVPVMNAEDKVKQAHQPAGAYYCYLIGRDLYLRTGGDPPGAEVSLKLYGTPLISKLYNWADELGTTTNTIPEHYRELLIQYLMWKLRIATATRADHFALAREWRTEFRASLREYTAERSGIGRKDSIYTTSFGKDVLS